MNEQELLEGFKAVFKVCGLERIIQAAAKVADTEGLSLDPDTFVGGLARDCVETVRIKEGFNLHPLAALALKIKAEKGRKYEHSGEQVALSLPYGASSILTELYKKLMAMIVADKAGTLNLSVHQEELVDMTIWEQFLWDYLDKEDKGV